MEEENKKLRKKAKREYNETVRGLAAFAKKRDKRVIDMQVKRNKEMEKKTEEERKRKKELEREKAERARAYKEQEWAKVEEMEEEFEEEVVEEGERKKEFYCVVYGKKFKSEKQWRKHEQSKKHKEKVVELREAFGDEGAMKGDAVKVSSLSEEKNGHVDSSLAEETTSSHSFVENETKGKDEDLSVKSSKVSKPAVDKKGTTKKDTDTKSKTASKGRKQKASSKTSSDNICEKCGADFESRTKLHKHLKDTGHAKLKSR